MTIEIKKNMLAVFLIIVLISAVGYLISNQTKNSFPETITIGWIGPLSGNVKFLGIDNLNAVKMAVEEYNINKNSNEPRVELIFEDDQYDENKSLQAYQTLVTKGAKIIFISTYDGMLLLEQKADKDKVILINPIDNDNQLAKLSKKNGTFLIAKRTEQLGELLSEHILQNNKKNILVLYYSEDLFMPTVAKSLKENFENYGGKTNLIGYSIDLKNFSQLLEQGVAQQADTYIFLGYIETRKIAQQALEMNISSIQDTHKFHTANTLIGEEFLHHFTYFTSEDGNKYEADKFLEEYEKKYNKKPIEEWTALQAYDASHIVLNTIIISSKQKGDLIENIKNNILSTKDFKGVSGNITIQPDGSALGIEWSMYSLENGKFTKEEKLN